MIKEGDVLRGNVTGTIYIVDKAQMESGRLAVRYTSYDIRGLWDRGTLWGVEYWRVTLIGRNYRSFKK